MKKTIYSVGVLIATFLLGGCNASLVDTNIPKLNTQLESTVKISSSNEEYECKLFHTPEKLTTLTFVSPENLKDFTISCREGMYEITQGGLEGEYTKNPLPKNSGIRSFIEILDILSGDERVLTFKNEEEGEKVYSGSIENKECIVVGKNNNIVRVSIKNPDLEVEFKS